MKSTAKANIAVLSMTLQRASEVSGLSVRKLYNLIAEKKLQSVTIGRRRLVRADSLRGLIYGTSDDGTGNGEAKMSSSSKK
jgi:excisionase family DNA binding protein